MKLPIEIVKKLKEPLPVEAITEHKTKPYLSNVIPAYVAERLNDVFGPAGWFVKYKVLDKIEKIETRNGKEVKLYQPVLAVNMLIPEYDIDLPGVGGCWHEDLGDAYKGGVSDAIGKIASTHLYIAIDVYKGLVKPSKSTSTTTKTTTSTTSQQKKTNAPTTTKSSQPKKPKFGEKEFKQFRNAYHNEGTAYHYQNILAWMKNYSFSQEMKDEIVFIAKEYEKAWQ